MVVGRGEAALERAFPCSQQRFAWLARRGTWPVGVHCRATRDTDQQFELFCGFPGFGLRGRKRCDSGSRQLGPGGSTCRQRTGIVPLLGESWRSAALSPREPHGPSSVCGWVLELGIPTSPHPLIFMFTAAFHSLDDCTLTTPGHHNLTQTTHHIPPRSFTAPGPHIQDVSVCKSHPTTSLLPQLSLPLHPTRPDLIRS